LPVPCFRVVTSLCPKLAPPENQPIDETKIDPRVRRTVGKRAAHAAPIVARATEESERWVGDFT